MVQVERSTRSAGNRPRIHRRRKTFVKRLLYLAVAALVAMLILVPTAMAQEMKMEMEQTVEKDLPKSGGVGAGSLALPAAALLIGGGVLGYAVLRRR
jgi:LPXTG cell wall anchor motif